MFIGNQAGITGKMFLIAEAQDIDDLCQDQHRAEFADTDNCPKERHKSLVHF